MAFSSSPNTNDNSMDEDYDYKIPAAGSSGQQQQPPSFAMNGHTAPPPPPPPANKAGAVGPSATSDEALLDLAQLEELHQEAERMKALGNKHMAAQEYTRAYNAYSAALQLSPVGPSSHVFLSNRAAALLSLKRYSAAATDARRAIALAPTFGKAHARLGQALYFLKEYPGAVAAYQDALRYEPENQVTATYLEKAKSKLEKQQRKMRGEEVSVMTGTDSHYSGGHSSTIATDPHNQDGILQSSQYYRGDPAALMRNAAAAAEGSGSGFQQQQQQPQQEQEDPDFEEALRIQQRANKFLANKQYKAAIEEYTAALFLVPDDPVLSPDLHMGRAHALNGSRRHESARNDAQLAIKLNPSPAAYSTLAKSLFYMKDYRGSVDAFKQCVEMLPPGEELGMFDKAYLQKAEAALEEEEYSLLAAGQLAPKEKSPVPKLPPPRFVPREQAINSAPTLPPMPKEWPQQSPRNPVTFRVGPERNVVFLSESLGIKLNRGSDGVVRVLQVVPNTAASPVARNGTIQAGDVVRECVGVDIRRPITNIMWGDTVALIKMAPRPITLVVAEELSPVPPAVQEELKRALAPLDAAPSPASTLSRVNLPSRSSGEEPVRDLSSPPPTPQQPETGDAPTTVHSSPQVVVAVRSLVDEDEEDGGEEEEHDVEGNGGGERIEVTVEDGGTSGHVAVANKEEGMGNVGRQVGDEGRASSTIETDREAAAAGEGPDTEPQSESELAHAEGEEDMVHGEVLKEETGEVDAAATGEKQIADETADEFVPVARPSLRDEEDRLVGGEILFEREARAACNGWDSLRWMSYSGVRKVRLSQVLFRYVEEETQQLFWKAVGSRFETRKLVIYEEPNVILVLRRPRDLEELVSLLDLADVSEAEETGASVESYFVVESVIDPQFCKLRLSHLTTVTSLTPEGSDGRRRSRFEVITPAENLLLSAVRVRDEARRSEQSFSDSGAFLETVAVETAITKSLCLAHDKGEDLGKVESDILWKHQIVLGTLHSLVLSGNWKALESAIAFAKSTLKAKEDAIVPDQLPASIVDAMDDNGRTPLYYACSCRLSQAVSILVTAGASVSSSFGPEGRTPCHICAANLDDKSLSTILSAPSRPDPNSLDTLGRTPTYVAMMNGRASSGERDAVALERCVMALEAWGGRMVVSNEGESFRRPVVCHSEQWSPEYLSVILDHLPFRYPLMSCDGLSPSPVATSLSAHFHYPLHGALLSLRNEDCALTNRDGLSSESSLVRTVRVLVEHGFEPNERLERPGTTFDGWELAEFVGHTPIQVLGSLALEFEEAKDSMDPKRYARLTALIAQTADVLVRSGARLSLDVPPYLRPRRETSGVSSVQEHAKDVWLLKLDSNGQVLKIFGGEERLQRARTEWLAQTSVNATARVTLSRDDDKSAIPDSSAAGGSDEKSCAICWKAYGTLVNRKHRCRVMRRYVCDDCSTKRIVQNGVEHRVSDGQFTLARADVAREAKEREEAVKERALARSVQSQKSLEEARQKAEEANRESLFGGVLEQATNFVFGEEQTERPVDQVQGLTETLGQTRDALNQRGEKLASLNEKTSQMVDASADFARMATELRKKSEGSWFG